MEKTCSRQGTKTRSKNILKISEYALCSLWLILACTPSVYLKDHKPTDLVFQKKVYGGIAALTGTELIAPGFSLYADGTVIYNQYVEGRRKLVQSRMSQGDFAKWYQRISRNLPVHAADSLLKNEESKNPAIAAAPVTEFYFGSEVTRIGGLGFYLYTPLVEGLQEFSKDLDALVFRNSRPYIAEKIILYVKRLDGGDTRAWPGWKIQEISLDLLYNKEVNFYEPNAEENSVLLEGETARQAQNVIEQAGIYQKFSFNGKIYAVGYRPVIPR